MHRAKAHGNYASKCKRGEKKLAGMGYESKAAANVMAETNVYR